jgi:hypothetical protein
MNFVRANWRFFAVLAMIAATAVFLDARRRTETIPRSEHLISFPSQIGPWSARDMPLDADTLAVLGPGDFLNRVYYQAEQPPLGLFIAYFPSQKTGDMIHSPKNCLPGSGWVFLSSGATDVNAGNQCLHDRSLHHRQGRRTPARSLLVPGARPRYSERILGQDLLGRGLHPYESQRWFSGPQGKTKKRQKLALSTLSGRLHLHSTASFPISSSTGTASPDLTCG